MNSKVYYIIAITVLLLSLVLYFEVHDEPFAATDIESSKSDENNESVSNNMSSESIKANVFRVPTGKSKSENADRYIEYTSDWCKKIDLSPADQMLLEQETSDWNQQIGLMPFSSFDRDGFLYQNGDSEKLPYLEISKSQLKQFVKEENAYAMMAALDRNDFTFREKGRIADDLLKLGYTGNAVIAIVIIEMISANSKYKTQKLSSEVLQHLKRALVIAIYSLELQDASGFKQIFRKLSSPGFNKEIDPSIVFTEADIKEAILEAELLLQNNNRNRLNRGMSSIYREETKVSQYLLDRDIGVMYALAPLSAKLFNEKFDSELSTFEMSDCRAKHTGLLVASAQL